MQDLNIALVQTNLFWENPKANRDLLEDHLSKVSQKCDLVILPEMFNTGFSMDVVKCSETMEGETVEWLKHQALKMDKAITGSLIINEERKYYNRLIIAYPDGTMDWYDKRHLFRMGGEDKKFSPGKTRKIFHCKGWKLFPQVCYDLRFPVWSRNDMDYDLIFYVANWPAVRSNHWKKLLQARAIENISYCVGVNRVEKDGKGVDHSGDSGVIDPQGNVLQTESNKVCVMEHCLSAAELHSWREKFPANQDSDQFHIEGTN